MPVISISDDEAPFGRSPPVLSIVPPSRHSQPRNAEHKLCCLGGLPEVVFADVKRKVLYAYMIHFHH
ncbi:unnamed protein product [Lampetra fluviatilis]